MASSTPSRLSSSSLQVNDPVHVDSEGSSSKLEGVVAFTGSVSFAEGTDWVGVRLTGTSAGQGKNDGSVEGVSYFECAPKCGIFVKRSHITKRVFSSRLEELRFRREIGAMAATNKETAKGTTSSSSTLKTSSSGGGPSAASTSVTLAKSKLAELQKRRLALDRRKEPATENAAAEAIPTEPNVSTDTPQPASQSKEIAEIWEPKVQELSDQLKACNATVDSLREEMLTAKNDASNAKSRIEELEQELEDAKQKSTTAVTIVRDDPGSQGKWEELQAQISQFANEAADLRDQLKQNTSQLVSLRKDLDQERKEHVADVDELTKVRSLVASYEKELQVRSEQATHRGTADASHYKEKAKLQADLAAFQRKVEQLEREKLELETTVEELTLDKEQLQEEKEALEERAEELRIDAETAQMEVEEVRMELEDAKATTERAIAGSSGSGGDSSGDADMAQALSVQNARLREALIRLREQSNIEKMELSRELRATEKEAEAGRALSTEVESLRSTKVNLEEQIQDLKDMVEQGSAFESMVEDLSDRVMALEDEVVNLQATIREMEEAGDITAEIEEAQADELKALNRDMEDRDTIIRNLEEAIKMQRRREEDFQRTVSNYRSTVETLKQEKNALLALQEGGEGAKSDMISASQKALARAAMLVSDAADLRKREAEAIMDRIEAQVQSHLSGRLESLLPQSVASSEISAMKGELLLSKVVGKASRSLEALSALFRKTVRASAGECISREVERASIIPGTSVRLSEDAKQGVATMLHQSDYAAFTIETTSELLRLLSASQWPDVLNAHASTELGSVFVHSVARLDMAIGSVLKTLKEEAVLSPHQFNLGEFQEATRSTMQGIHSLVERDGQPLLLGDWKPPGFQLIKDASAAKFLCLGAAAAVASVIKPPDAYSASVDSSSASVETQAVLKSLVDVLDRLATESTKTSLRLARLDVRNKGVVNDLTEPISSWKASASKLLDTVRHIFLNKDVLSHADVSACELAANGSLRDVIQLSSALRSAHLIAEEENTFHPLSPETVDAWQGVSSLARLVRSTDGDEEDLNYLARARSIEKVLAEAVENGPKLAHAYAKVSTLEKNLATRSKEIAVQNARLAELEKLLAKTSMLPTRKTLEASSLEEISKLKEENRVLTEAMDVLQRQVDEYEFEIRLLKEGTSATPRGTRTPRRSQSTVYEKQPGRFMDEGQGKESSGALEAALLRPALEAVRRDAARWKSKDTVTTLLELPPLWVPSSDESKSEDADDGAQQCLFQLSGAILERCLEMASVTVVDLSNKTRSPREILRETKAKKNATDERLEEALADARRWLVNH